MDNCKWRLYYKHVIALVRVMNYAYTFVNYAPRVTLQIVMSLTDDSGGIIYDRNMFIVQAPGFTMSTNFCSWIQERFLTEKGPFYLLEKLQHVVLITS
jgi:hypothetical protein